jgi:hypothetical protein
MQIRLKRTASGPWGCGQPGDLIEADGGMATRLLADDHAEHPWEADVRAAKAAAEANATTPITVAADPVAQPIQ